MNADDFVLILRQVASEVRGLEARFSPVDIEAVQRPYICELRPGVAPSDEPLLDLIRRYDCSRVTVATIRFLAQPVEYPWAWIVAKDETDPVILDKQSGRVRIQELRAGGISPDGYFISECAKTSNMFLDAMALAAEGLVRLAVEGADEGEQTVYRDLATRCANAAGGPEYLGHYLTMIGGD